MAKEYRTVFSHHFSGSFDFNTVNIHHTVGTDFLIQFPRDGFGQRMAAHLLESRCIQTRIPKDFPEPLSHVCCMQKHNHKCNSFPEFFAQTCWPPGMFWTFCVSGIEQYWGQAVFGALWPFRYTSAPLCCTLKDHTNLTILFRIALKKNPHYYTHVDTRSNIFKKRILVTVKNQKTIKNGPVDHTK